MPRKLELTWVRRLRRWKKKYNGKQYYFAFGETKDDRAGYQKALAAWRTKKAELDAAAGMNPHREAYEFDLLMLRRMIDRFNPNGSALQALKEREGMSDVEWELYVRKEWTAAKEAERVLEERIRDGYEHPDVEDAPGAKSLDEHKYQIPGPAPWEQTAQPHVPPEKSIGGCIKLFVERKVQLAAKGEMTHGRADVLRHCLAHFEKYAGKNRPLEEINRQLLIGYRDHLELEIANGKTSARYAKDRIQAVKQFVKHLWELELIEMPRVMQGNLLRITAGQKKIVTFDSAEVEKLLAAATGGLRLYMLLMLNCGMTQQDIADLKPHEVDWTLGRVTRKRSKTKKFADVPEVTYTLWDETFKLLKKYRSKSGDRVLMSTKGQALKRDATTDGKYSKTDVIGRSYRRLLKRLEIPTAKRKPIKLLRKTAATKLGEHPTHGRFAQHFLGHSPRTIADKHYVRPSDEQFNEAVRWLGVQFGYTTKRAATKSAGNKK